MSKAVRRLCKPSKSCHVLKGARPSEQALSEAILKGHSAFLLDTQMNSVRSLGRRSWMYLLKSLLIANKYLSALR